MSMCAFARIRRSTPTDPKPRTFDDTVRGDDDLVLEAVPAVVRVVNHLRAVCVFRVV